MAGDDRGGETDEMRWTGGLDDMGLNTRDEQS